MIKVQGEQNEVNEESNTGIYKSVEEGMDGENKRTGARKTYYGQVGKILSGFLLLGAILILGGCGQSQSSETAQLKEIVQNNSLSVPSRAPEINGVVVAVEGNKVTVKNEIGRKPLTAEEQAKRRAERQKLSPEERRALRERETANLKTEKVTLTVPAGTVIVKGSGKGDGSSVKASFSDIKPGVYISAWMNGDQVEAIKVKGI